ncbi:hypothetical protein J5289_21490 [Rhizobium sp. B230/85]|uniref:hypothetical protein n=1 Tax=unclassified Rhizobium TaxID=2613769 RepID=UPI001ADAF965|nr:MULTISPECIES: hypothetical protein [unclassified Rhizobium]MBO9136781.1 hypothetical protein [Rhizobium sp. B209b/85]QXZ99071.1 hypothetical protein J5289_21490 [Rhizobium sp. B230/85]
MEFGFLTIAIGAKKYIRQAEFLCRSLKKNMPGIPIAVVTDCESFVGNVDFIVPPNSDYSIGAIQKILIDTYSPFERTLFIDSDCIVTKPFNDQLLALRGFEFTPAMEHFVPSTGSDFYIVDLEKALSLVGGSRFPKFNGGIYYFERGDFARKIFEMAREYAKSPEKLGIKRFDAAGVGDETVIALALAHYHVDNLYFDSGELMRTPTGLEGKITIEPLGGGCSFTGSEGWMAPAICHFAGKYINRSEYYLAKQSLMRNVSVQSLGSYQYFLAFWISGWRSFMMVLKYKLSGLRRRYKSISARLVRLAG